MVKVGGKKLRLSTSEYVSKDLAGPKGKRGKKQLKAKKVQTPTGKIDKKGKKKVPVKEVIDNGDDSGEGGEENELGEVVGNEVRLAEVRMSDAPAVKKVK